MNTFETSNVSKILQLFSRLNRSEKVEVAERINKETFKVRWKVLDKELPDVEMSDEEVMKEIQAVRGKRKDSGHT